MRVGHAALKWQGMNKYFSEIENDRIKGFGRVRREKDRSFLLSEGQRKRRLKKAFSSMSAKKTLSFTRRIL